MKLGSKLKTLLGTWCVRETQEYNLQTTLYSALSALIAQSPTPSLMLFNWLGIERMDGMVLFSLSGKMECSINLDKDLAARGLILM